MYVTTVAPILLGLATDAVWRAPLLLLVGEPAATARLVFYVTVASLLASFIPVIGRIPTISTAAGGCLTLLAVVRSVSEPSAGLRTVNMWPGVWSVLGFLVVGFVATWMIFLLFIPALATMINRESGKTENANMRFTAHLGVVVACFVSRIWSVMRPGNTDGIRNRRNRSTDARQLSVVAEERARRSIASLIRAKTGCCK